jgi:hypothetical protein
MIYDILKFSMGITTGIFFAIYFYEAATKNKFTTLLCALILLLFSASALSDISFLKSEKQKDVSQAGCLFNVKIIEDKHD